MKSVQCSRRSFALLSVVGAVALRRQLANAIEAPVASRHGAENLGGPFDLPHVSPAQHWSIARSESWRWYEREDFISGRWQTTGITTPIDRRSGQPIADDKGYIDECLVPDAVLLPVDRKRLNRSLLPIDTWQDRNIVGNPAITTVNRSAADPAMMTIDFGDRSQTDAGRSSSERRSRHGRPPSEWLRSLTAEEIRIWLARVEIQEALVSGMTFEIHLTRDHSFAPDQIASLTEAELAELHGAAHEGF